MSILLECTCGKKLKVRDELVGKKVKCPTCGNIVVAPTPVMDEPLDVLEMVEEDKPPAAAAKASAKPASTNLKAPPAAWESDKNTSSAAWDSKKKSAAARNRADAYEDDDEGEETPTPFWLFPGTLSTEVMALTPEGIYFANLKGDALEGAGKLMKNCTPAAQALGEKAIYIPRGLDHVDQQQQASARFQDPLQQQRRNPQQGPDPGWPCDAG